MHEIKIQTVKNGYPREQTFHLPENWNEMNYHYITTFCYVMNLNIPDKEIRKTILYRWMKIKPNQFFKMRTGDLEELYPLLDFLFSKEIDSGKLMMPMFQYNWRSFYGPGNDFCFLTVAEFAVAEMLMQKYAKERNEKDLNKMVSVLYRKANKDTFIDYKETGSDPRTPFSDKMLDRLGASIATIPLWYKQAALYNFIAFHTHVNKKFEFLYDPGNTPKAGNMGWAGIIHSLAGPELGTMDDVERMPFLNAMIILTKLHFERKRLEESYKN